MKTANTILLVTTLTALTVGCIDIERGGDGWEVADRPGREHTSPPIQNLPADVPVILAVHGDCEYESFTDGLASHPSNEQVAAVTEIFGDDGCLTERSLVRSDDLGRPIHIDWDFFVSWLPAYAYVVIRPTSTDFTYDAFGEEVLGEVRNWNASELRYARRTSFDDARRMVRRQTIGDHEWDLASRVHDETWTFADDGVQTSYVRTTNGEVVTSERLELDHASRPSRRFRANSGDEWLDHEYFYEGPDLVRETYYELPGTLVTETHHTYRDGIRIESRMTHHRNGWFDVHRFDDEGREVYYSQDDNQDGVIDFEREASFDRWGNRTHEAVRYEFDARRNPQRGDETTRTFDAQGRLVRAVTVKKSFDASRQPNYVDVRSTITRTYDAAGGFEQLTEGSSPVTPTVRAYGAWLDEDTPLWTLEDRDRDGTPEYRTEYLYDAIGQHVATTVDAEDDGVPNSTSTWTYDAQGRLLTSMVDVDGDGIAEARTEHRFGVEVEKPAQSVGETLSLRP